MKEALNMYRAYIEIYAEVTKMQRNWYKLCVLQYMKNASTFVMQIPSFASFS
jgi:hypothetical protein